MLRYAADLKVDAVRLHVRNKGPALAEVLAEIDSSPETTCAIGDDLTDVPVLRGCAMAVAVADAVEEVRAMADYVTTRPGGAGAVREVIERILRRSGRWEGILARYFPAGAEATA